MRTPLPALLRTLALAAVLAAASLTTAPPSLAAQECQFLLDDGSIRPCTFTERYGQCLFWAYQSYQDCLSMGDGWTDSLVCELGLQVDLLACTLEMIGDGVRLLSPF